MLRFNSLMTDRHTHCLIRDKTPGQYGWHLSTHLKTKSDHKP